MGINRISQKKRTFLQDLKENGIWMAVVIPFGNRLNWQMEQTASGLMDRG